MATLAEILELLPDVGRERLAYQSRYWILKANELLSMIETSVRGSVMYEEGHIVLNGRQTRYPVPPNLRKVQRVRWPDENGIRDPRTDLNGVSFEMRSGNICLFDPPGITATMFGMSQGVDSFNFVRSSLSIPVDPSVVEGWGCTIQHGAAVSFEYRRIIGINADYPDQIDLDGNTADEIKQADTANFYDKYLIVEGQKKLKRFTETSSLSPLPEEWNQILVYGLRWALESQSEEDGSSQNSLMWLNRFENALQGFEGDASERPGDQGRINPRPSCFWEGFGR